MPSFKSFPYQVSNNQLCFRHSWLFSVLPSSYQFLLSYFCLITSVTPGSSWSELPSLWTYHIFQIYRNMLMTLPIHRMSNHLSSKSSMVSTMSDYTFHQTLFIARFPSLMSFRTLAPFAIFPLYVFFLFSISSLLTMYSVGILCALCHVSCNQELVYPRVNHLTSNWRSHLHSLPW